MRRIIRILAAIMLFAAASVGAAAAEFQDGVQKQLLSDRFTLYSLPSDGAHAVMLGPAFENGLMGFHAEFDGTYLYGLMDSECHVLLQPEYKDIFALHRPYQSGSIKREIQNLLILIRQDGLLQLYNARTRTLCDGTYDAVADCRKEYDAYDNAASRSYVAGELLLLEQNGKFGAADLDGKIIVPCEYDKGFLAADNRAVFAKNGVTNVWLFDEFGNMLTHDYSSIGGYVEGRAGARKTDPKSGLETDVLYWLDLAGQIRIRWDQAEKGYIMPGVFEGGLLAIGGQYLDANGGLHASSRAQIHTYQLECINNIALDTVSGRRLSPAGFPAAYADSFDNDWISIHNETTGHYALADRRSGIITPCQYDSYRLCIHNTEEYILVSSNGKYGVLGADCRTLIPMEYDTISAPNGMYDYFVAKRTVSISGYSLPRYTLYNLSGEIVGEPDGIEDYRLSKAHITGLAYGTLSGGQFVLIRSDGTVVSLRGGWIGDWQTASPDTMAVGIYGCDYGEPEQYGIFTPDGAFHPLYDKTTGWKLQNLPYAEFTGGSAYVSSTELGTHEYLLHDTQWQYHYEEKDTSTDITLQSSSPADGQTGVPVRTDTVSLQFSCPIAVVDPDRITITGEYDDPAFEIVSANNCVQLRLTDEFFEGDKYTVTIEPSALTRTDRAQIYNEKTIQITFTLDGLSTNDLLTKYPGALTQTQEISMVFSGAASAVENMVQYYCGDYGEGKLLTSLFYASKETWSLTTRQLAKLITGSDKNKEKFVQQAADLLIGRMCMDYNVRDSSERATATTNLIALMKTLDYGGDLHATQKLLDAVKTYCKAYDIPYENSAIRILVDFFLTVPLPILKTSYETLNNGGWDRITGTTDLVGNYLIAMIQYLHMEQDAMKTLLAYLPSSGDLYHEIARRLDMTQGDQLLQYLKRSAMDLFLNHAAGTLCSVVSGAVGELGAARISGIETALSTLGKLYGSLTGRADADQHIEVLMLTCYAQELSNAHTQLCLDLLQSGATPQRKADLRRVYEAKCRAWCILLETAADLRLDSAYYHDDCLLWGRQIETECTFADYIRSCKRAAPYSAAQYTTDGQTLTGYRRYDAAQESSEPERLDKKNDEAVLYVSGTGSTAVKSIGVQAFADETTLQAVTLADGITVEARAFAGCKNLRTVTFEGSNEIDSSAFAGCSIQTVYGKTQTAQDFAARVGAEYLDTSPQLLSLAVSGAPALTIQPGDTEPDLSGLHLTATGLDGTVQSVLLEDCCVLVPQTIGQTRLQILYLDQIVSVPLNICLRSAYADSALIVTYADTESDVLTLGGTATGDTILAAVYSPEGKFLQTAVCSVADDGSFSLSIPAGTDIRLYLIQDGKPQVPVLLCPVT